MKVNPIRKSNANRRHAPEYPEWGGKNLYQRQKPLGKTMPVFSNNDVEFAKEFDADNTGH